MKLILASASQRRRELLDMCGYDFEIEVSRSDERIDETDPKSFVSKLAEAKAAEVFDRLCSALPQHGCASSEREFAVLGSDTVVYHNGSIIGKPRDEKDAIRILSELSGKTHEVYTGVAVITADKRLVECDITRVTFSELSEEEIEKYVASGEPMDKAGAYGIQGPFGMFVQKVEGNYFTVIGLPLPRAYRMLKSVGVLPRSLR